ncbi:hypothetical protein [uncultured Sulfitobacter sp.]|uniref:hypothetical protein n=1 Tax=uncultured Sulfitobacter sp. TaxID=191468 RepID=UPI002637D253|nr:hypothetical protein [uncultured Sulfitobacter sp.]
MKHLFSPKRVVIAVLALGIASAGALTLAQTMHGGGHRHGAGHMHDEVNMPGLRGENATAQESAEIAILFRGFETITREVENLPNGIKTITRSSDVAVREALISHSVGMIDRVDQLDDPKIIIQSPTLDIFFLRGAAITSSIDIVDDGLVVVQTSDDLEVVAALHTHAAEVTAMTERGMDAVHDMMMERGTGH